MLIWGLGIWLPYTPPPKYHSSYQRRESKTARPSISPNSWLCARGSYNEGFVLPLLNHSEFPVGPSILQTQPCSLPCDERSSMDKIDNPRVNSDTPWAKQLRAGAEKADAVGGMSILSQQLVLGPFASPGRKQQAKVLMHFSLRNCCYSFVSRPPTCKTEKEREREETTGREKQKWREGREGWRGEGKGEKRNFNELPAGGYEQESQVMPIVAMLSVRKTAVQKLDGSHHLISRRPPNSCFKTTAFVCYWPGLDLNWWPISTPSCPNLSGPTRLSRLLECYLVLLRIVY